MTNEQALIAWFRASTSYINAHRGKTFVIHLGGRLLSELERKAEQQNHAYVYALTTVASHFFLENGFVELGVESLPNSREPLYNCQRNSKILKKQLKG
jgi:N-acetylglutamate synthase-like GNAT family acetyltransferase